MRLGDYLRAVPFRLIRGCCISDRDPYVMYLIAYAMSRTDRKDLTSSIQSMQCNAVRPSLLYATGYARYILRPSPFSFLLSRLNRPTPDPESAHYLDKRRTCDSAAAAPCLGILYLTLRSAHMRQVVVDRQTEPLVATLVSFWVEGGMRSIPVCTCTCTCKHDRTCGEGGNGRPNMGNPRSPSTHPH